MFLFFRMGSFTSMPKIKPAANADDDDVEYGDGNLEDITTVLSKCQEQLESLPPPIQRQWRSNKAATPAVMNSEGTIDKIPAGIE